MIIVRLSGGMGNQMFQYALGRHLSLKNNVPLKLDLEMLKIRSEYFARSGAVFREYDLDVFNVHAETVSKNEIPFLRRSYFSGYMKSLFERFRQRLLWHNGKERKNGRFQASVLDAGPDTYLEGHWQSERYFSDIADIIRSDFTLAVPQSDGIQKLGEQIRSCNSICVHIRRSDFVGNAFHDIGITPQYYARGVEEIATKTAIDGIYVFSDDIAWCKENLMFNHETFFVEETYAGYKQTGHFWLMQQCGHFVIANSSYSWWAAWLATNRSKIIIAPKKWFHDQSLATDDVVPEHWIRL